MPDGEKNRHSTSENTNQDETKNSPIEIFDNLIKRLKNISFAALLALVIGISFIVFSAYLKSGWDWSALSEAIVHDLGIGFIVGAVVGIAYDMLKEINSRFKKEKKFDDNIKILDEFVRKFNDPETVIKNKLNVIFQDEKYHSFSESVMSLIHETKEIKGLEGNAETKEIKDYVDMLNWLIKKYAVSNASQFRRLLQALNENERDSVEFTPPDRRDAMLQLLSAQMKSMEKGDCYHSVTNVWLYNNMSDEYISCTENALKKGVTIRRIFNVCDAEVPERDRGNIESERKSIKRQIDIFGHNSGFQYRYLTSGMLSKLDGQILRHCGISDPKDVRKLFFGHFYHLEAKKMLRFEPDRMKITKIRINVYPFDAKTQDIVSFEELFEHIWENGEREFPAIVHVAADPGSDMYD